MLATHKDAESRYTKIRKAVIHQINADLATDHQARIHASLIDPVALAHAARWSTSAKRRVDWQWLDGYAAFKFRYPKRFEMALWHDATLASLSLGRPTYRGTKLRLDFIEGNPDGTEVKVFEYTFLAMAGYAQALGADELRVMNPINAEVKRYYESFGFSYVATGNYLYTRL